MAFTVNIAVWYVILCGLGRNVLVFKRNLLSPSSG